MTYKEIKLTSLTNWQGTEICKKYELEVKLDGKWCEVVNVHNSMFWVKGQEKAILDIQLPLLTFRAKVG